MHPLRPESPMPLPGGVTVPLQRDFWKRIMQIKAARHRNTPQIVQGVQGLGAFFSLKTPFGMRAGFHFPGAEVLHYFRAPSGWDSLLAVSTAQTFGVGMAAGWSLRFSDTFFSNKQFSLAPSFAEKLCEFFHSEWLFWILRHTHTHRACDALFQFILLFQP